MPSKHFVYITNFQENRDTNYEKLKDARILPRFYAYYINYQGEKPNS